MRFFQKRHWTILQIQSVVMFNNTLLNRPFVRMTLGLHFPVTFGQRWRTDGE